MNENSMGITEKIGRWLETTVCDWKEFSKTYDAEYKALLKKEEAWLKAARRRGSIF